MKGGNPFGPNQRRKFQLQQQPLCPSFTREGRHPRCLLCVFNGQVSFEIKLSYKSCNILIKLPFFLGSFPKISYKVMKFSIAAHRKKPKIELSESLVDGVSVLYQLGFRERSRKVLWGKKMKDVGEIYYAEELPKP